MIDCNKCPALNINDSKRARASLKGKYYCNKYKCKLTKKFKHSPIQPCAECIIEKKGI